ncbi:MAG: chromosome segregation protein SMC [Chitinivibrionales bacterium]|nr:chromosome segregation protein SMC [Chitinivibrionales bacterium]
MVLRGISIYGFKSFADKIEMDFGEGITAIVGPNGCGKSNVVDAIRWVFGEQKASALRSSSMQDVIFSGTQFRQPLNMAEVTLVIENTRQILPIDYKEVGITRRVFRNGESEYRINKVPCRLRDINNLFLDTGVGSNSYTTIENHMIDAILSDKADERRVLFEEAAGIGKYKQRRKESQRKLEYTRQDLLRINDKVHERTQYVTMLARQVEKAKRYRKYYDELKALELGFGNRHYSALSQKHASGKSEHAELESAYETRRAETASMESRIEELNCAMAEKENELQEAAQKVADANEGIIATDKHISVTEETLKHLKENTERFDHERNSLEEQAQQKTNLKLNIEKSITENESILQRHQENFESIQQELSHYDATIAEKKQNTSMLAQHQIDMMNAMAEQRNAISEIQSAIRTCLDLQERDKKEIDILSSRKEEYSERLTEVKKQLEDACEEDKNLYQSRSALVSRIEREDERYRKLLEREKQLEAQIDSLKSQFDFLKGLDAQLEGYENGVQALLKEDIQGKLGTVADLISISDEKIAGIVERVLSSEIQTVVFRSNDDLKMAVDFLNNEPVGTARMMSLERVTRSEPLRPVSESGSCGNLTTYISTSDEFRGLAEHLFGRFEIVNDINQALELSESGDQDRVYISRDGVVCSGNGMVIAGSSHKEQTGILTRKQRIESLPKEIEINQKEFQKIVNEKEVSIITRDEAKVALTEVNARLSAGQRKQQECETNIKHYENELENLKDKLYSLQEQLDRTGASMQEHEDTIAKAQEKLVSLENEKNDTDLRLQAAKEGLVEMEEGRKDITDRLTNAQLRIQGDRHKQEQNAMDLANLAKEIEDIAGKRQQLLEEKQQAEHQYNELTSQVRTLKNDIRSRIENRQELQDAHAKIREEYNHILSQIDETRRRVKEKVHENENLYAKIAGLNNELTRAEEKMRNIRERVFESYKVDLESCDVEIPDIEGEDRDIEENITRYKDRLGRLVGQVNMSAPEEYEEKNNELQEMIQQRDDLQTAVEDLERAIKKLNKEARAKFAATFEEVQKNFTQMFTTLFEGGQASLSLEENVDPLEARIHINARPPGKKMRGVQLLSGGERALTAISLLFALYMVRPSAYCILDELDAPLDDANVERFVRALRHFTEKTQFIIVTHNKRTMESADLLYGVTQQEKGVSTVVSVRLEEAYRHAA